MSKLGSTRATFGAVATLLSGLLLPSGLARADRFAALPLPVPTDPQPMPAPTAPLAPPRPVTTNLPVDGVFPSNGAFAIMGSSAGSPVVRTQTGTVVPTAETLLESWLVVAPNQVLAFQVAHELQVAGAAGSEIFPFTVSFPCPNNFTEVELTAQLRTFETYGPADVCCEASGSMPAFCASSTRVQLPAMEVSAGPSATAPGAPVAPRMCLSQYFMRSGPGSALQPAWLSVGPTRSFTEPAAEYCTSVELVRVRDGQSLAREVCVPHGDLQLPSREVAPFLPHGACAVPPPDFEDVFCMQNSMACNGLNPPMTCEPHRELCGWLAAQTPGTPATPTPTTPTTPPPMWPQDDPADSPSGGAAGSGAGSGTPTVFPRPRDTVPAEEDMRVPAQSCGCHALGSKGATRGAGVLLGLLALGLSYRRARR